MDNAFKYIKDQGGIDTEDSYPYEAQEDRKCRYNPSDSGATDVGFIDVTSGDENALKSAIATQVEIEYRGQSSIVGSHSDTLTASRDPAVWPLTPVRRPSCSTRAESTLIRAVDQILRKCSN